MAIDLVFAFFTLLSAPEKQIRTPPTPERSRFVLKHLAHCVLSRWVGCLGTESTEWSSLMAAASLSRNFTGKDRDIILFALASRTPQRLMMGVSKSLLRILGVVGQS